MICKNCCDSFLFSVTLFYLYEYKLSHKSGIRRRGFHHKKVQHNIQYNYLYENIWRNLFKNNLKWQWLFKSSGWVRRHLALIFYSTSGTFYVCRFLTVDVKVSTGVIMARHLRFIARTVMVQDRNVDAAYKTLNRSDSSIQDKKRNKIKLCFIMQESTS